MRFTRKILAVLLSLLMLALCVPAASAEGSITWSYDPASRTLTIGGSGNMPDYMDSGGRPWNGVCKELQNLVIQNGITGIGRNAFIYCSALKSVSIPNSVKSIGITAFQNCSKMTSADLGSGVERIGPFAFEACYDLADVTMGNNVTDIAQSAFMNCQKLHALTLSTSVSNIGDHAFENCYALPALTLPNSLKTIGERAFLKNRSLQTVTIPGSVTSIGTAAFADCTALQAVNFGGTKSQWNSISKGSFVFGLWKGDSYADRTASEALTFNFDMANVTLTLFSSTWKKSVTNAGGTVKGSGTFSKGTQTVITAIPDSGFVFDGWYSVHAVEGSLTALKFSNANETLKLNENMTLAALFVKATGSDCSVFATASEGGTASGGGMFHPGQTAQLTATPNSGWIFVGWFSGETKLSSSADYAFQVTQSTTLTARFEKVEPVIEPNPSDLPDGDQTHIDKNNDGKCDDCGEKMTGGDHCPQCGKIHKGFFQKIVGFFHKIIYRLTHLFSKK